MIIFKLVWVSAVIMISKGLIIILKMFFELIFIINIKILSMIVNLMRINVNILFGFELISFLVIRMIFVIWYLNDIILFLKVNRKLKNNY